jgi:biopolymer transport protein ExbB
MALSAGICMVCPAPVQAFAQEPLSDVTTPDGAKPNPEQAQKNEDAARKADDWMAQGKSEADAADNGPSRSAAGGVSESINLLDLMIRGQWLMLPIAAMSLLVVAFGVERLLGLRRRRVLPNRLINGLGGMAGEQKPFDPRRAYRLCQQHPSSASRVIRAMLLKVGRPHSELEHAISQANDREAAKLYANVRWLSLAAGVTPLLGLLGTVWGMIQAFFATANLPLGANKATVLADGIYTALVTTFAGLAVAIPAAILAHFFEGRIQKLLNELDETLQGLLPQLERYEGRLRFSQDEMEKPESHAACKAAPRGTGPVEPAATRE